MFVCVCVCGIREKLFPKFFEKYQDLIKKHLDEIVLAFQKKKEKKNTNSPDTLWHKCYF